MTILDLLKLQAFHMKKNIIVFLGIMVSGSVWSVNLKCSSVRAWCSEDETNKMNIPTHVYEGFDDINGITKEECVAYKQDILHILKCKDNKFNVGFMAKDLNDSQNQKATIVMGCTKHSQERGMMYSTFMKPSSIVLPTGEHVAYAQDIDGASQGCIERDHDIYISLF